MSRQKSGLNAYKTLELAQRPDLTLEEILDKPLNSYKDEMGRNTISYNQP